MVFLPTQYINDLNTEDYQVYELVIELASIYDWNRRMLLLPAGIILILYWTMWLRQFEING